MTSPASVASASSAPALPRLELRIERLRASYRFTYAFHAREVRFERDDGSGYQSVFPETFSFHAARHDPTELYLRLDDLWTNPRRLSADASSRVINSSASRRLASAESRRGFVHRSSRRR
jgi:hypothetical protein